MCRVADASSEEAVYILEAALRGWLAYVQRQQAAGRPASAVAGAVSSG